MDYMKIAIEEAKKAYYKDEVPIGCVIVRNNEIISQTHNLRELNQNALHHAEVLAIDAACKNLKSWRLDDCDMYVTIEPCLMCSGAIINARIKNLYIGYIEPKTGAVTSQMDVLENNNFNHQVNVEVLNNIECLELMQKFFRDLRLKKK